MFLCAEPEEQPRLAKLRAKREALKAANTPTLTPVTSNKPFQEIGVYNKNIGKPRVEDNKTSLCSVVPITLNIKPVAPITPSITLQMALPAFTLEPTAYKVDSTVRRNEKSQPQTERSTSFTLSRDDANKLEALRKANSQAAIKWEPLEFDVKSSWEDQLEVYEANQRLVALFLADTARRTADANKTAAIIEFLIKSELYFTSLAESQPTELVHIQDWFERETERYKTGISAYCLAELRKYLPLRKGVVPESLAQNKAALTKRYTYSI